MDKKEKELYESKIHELELENKDLKTKLVRLNAQVNEYQEKEQSISKAIVASMEHASRLETSMKKLYSLDIQRSRFLYLRMEQMIKELYDRYPDLLKDTRLKETSEQFKLLVFDGLSDNVDDEMKEVKAKHYTDDPIKKLLSNIIACIDSKKSDDNKKVMPNKIEELPKSKSGFDFYEALHPTMGLDEIMKSFNNTGKTSSK